jgi:DNA-binding transcriptional LysR family regulator
MYNNSDMNDELGAAEIFLQVVRSQGFSSAAKALGKSVSTVSRAVTDLEAHLGAQLLTRTTRRLHLTEAGSVFVTHAESMVAAKRAAHDAITELTGVKPRGQLRVSMPVSVGERLLGPHLPSFLRRYPDLRLVVDLSDRNVQLLEGGFDLAIRVGRPADSALRAQLLGRIPVRLVASPGYVSSRGAPKKPSDIAEHPCVSVGPAAGPSEWTFFRGLKRESVAINAAIHTTSPTLAAQLTRAGLGLMRTTDWIIRDELRRGQLVEVMPGWSCNHPQRGGVPVFAMYSQTAAAVPPLKTRVFVDLVKTIMASEVLLPK